MKNMASLVVLGLCCLGGCRCAPHQEARFDIYIESWDRISFAIPEILDGDHPKWHSRVEATRIVLAHRDSLGSCADVMLGKSLHADAAAVEAKIDAIQKWLESCGITDMTFRLAMSDVMPPVVRVVEDGHEL